MDRLRDKTERPNMTIVDMLRANAEKYPSEVALVEVNPERRENRHITWRDYDLVETTDDEPFRREMTWSVFDEKDRKETGIGQILFDQAAERFGFSGIAPEERKRVFDRFYRALGTKAQGHGLGLAIVKRIVEIHHGEIQIEDGLDGKGTTMRIQLPALTA